MKKKKLALVLLALVMAVGGGAAMTACDPNKPDDPNQGQTQNNEYTVKFKSDTGVELSSVKVKHGNAAVAPSITEKAGYKSQWVDENGAVAKLDSITADVTFTLQYVANTDTAYTVEHYVEGVDGKYTLESTENLTGTTDTTVNATVKTMEHYVQATGAGEVLSGTVKGDGTLTLKVYYARERKTVTFTADGKLIDTQEIRYGAVVTGTDKPVPAKDKTESEEYSLSHWSLTENGPAYDFTKPVEGDLALVAVYKKTARHYKLEGQLGVNGMYYLAYNDEGDAWDEKEDFDQNSIEYNTTFSFKITYEGDEVYGNPIVTLTKYDDNGNVKSTETLEADEDGYYTTVINAETKLEIAGLVLKEYTVDVEAGMAEFPLSWAAKVNPDDVIVRLTDRSGADTYHENVIVNGKAQLKGVKGGVYYLTFVMKNENGGYEALSDEFEFEVNASIADEELVYTFTPEKPIAIGVHNVTLEGTGYDVINGVITNVVGEQTKNYQMHASFDDFAPGEADFAVTATWQRDTSKVTEESDPTFGFGFTVEGTNYYPEYNKDGFRLRGLIGDQKDIGGVVPVAGKALGSDNNAYDKITLVTVRKNGKIYMYYTGEKVGNANIQKTVNKLVAVMSADGFAVCNGTTFADDEGNFAKLATGSIDKVTFVQEQTTNCWVNVYGFGYTYDADVIASYADVVSAKANVTGDIQKQINLETARTNKVNLDVPAGKVVDSLTVNGTTTAFMLTDSGIQFEIAVPFDGGNFNVNVALKDGAYSAVITGTVTGKGKPVVGARVTDGKVYTYTDANGSYTLKTAVAESYELTAVAADFTPAHLTVTDLTKAADISLISFMMGGSTTIGNVTYVHGSIEGDGLGSNAASDPYTIGVDENGNEIVTSGPGKSARSTVLYNNFAASKFVAMASIKYDVVTDAWPRIGFTVADANYNRGMISFYGGGYSSIYITNWGGGSATENPGLAWNGNANAIIGAGKLYIAMIYDEGNVKFYAKNQKFTDPDKWYLIYDGKMPGGELSGPVAVGLLETSDKPATFTYSDFYIAELGDEFNNIDVTADGAKVEIKDGVVTATLEEGKTLKNATFDGKNIMSQGALNGNVFTYKLPALWEIGKHELVIETKNASTSLTYTGSVSFEGSKDITVKFVNEDGVAFETKTDASGSFGIDLVPGKYTATISAPGAFDAEGEVTLTDSQTSLGEVWLAYGFNGSAMPALGEGGTGTATNLELLDFVYDKTQNPYDTLVINTKDRNHTILWAQPIAANASWGFTLEFPENISMTPDGRYFDQDMYWRWYVGVENTYAHVGMNSNGGLLGNQAWHLHDGEDNNPYDGWGGDASYGMQGGLKQKWSVGDVRAIDVMFVREGKKISKYSKYADETEWQLIGWNDNELSESEPVYFKMYNSARNPLSDAECNYSIKNWKYSTSNACSVNVNANANVTVTLDKETYASGENVNVTAAADDGYLVRAINVNGNRYLVDAAKTVTVKTKAFAGVNTEISAEVVSGALTLTGTVTIPDTYAEYFNANSGTVTFEGPNGRFVGTIENGTYKIEAPAGKYSAKFSTGEYKLEKEVEVTSEKSENVVLTEMDEGMFKRFAGDGLAFKDGVLRSSASGNTQETSFNATFVPNNQILEFGYTFKGNCSGAVYPFFGMFVGNNTDNVGRVCYTGGAGDQIYFLTSNDWTSRLAASDRAWELWKGGFIPGQGNGSNLNARGQYWDQAYTNLQFKFRVDGYNLSMWIKGTNKWMQGEERNVNFEDWVCCFENLNIYDRYNTDGNANADTPRRNHLNQLYKLDEACYFGVSAREDIGGFATNFAQYADLWFNIEDRQ